MNTKENKLYSYLIIISMLVSTSTISLIIYGAVAVKLWDWFIVPLFGIRPISIAEVIGLSLFISLFVSSSKYKEEKEIDEYAGEIIKVFIHTFLRSALVLLIGWIVYQFV